MTNYEHYQATVEKVNAAILREATVPWQIKYQAPDEASNLQSEQQPLLMVAPGGKYASG